MLYLNTLIFSVAKSSVPPKNSSSVPSRPPPPQSVESLSQPAVKEECEKMLKKEKPNENLVNIDSVPTTVNK